MEKPRKCREGPVKYFPECYCPGKSKLTLACVSLLLSFLWSVFVCVCVRARICLCDFKMWCTICLELELQVQSLLPHSHRSSVSLRSPKSVRSTTVRGSDLQHHLFGDLLWLGHHLAVLHYWFTLGANCPPFLPWGLLSCLNEKISGISWDQGKNLSLHPS